MNRLSSAAKIVVIFGFVTDASQPSQTNQYRGEVAPQSPDKPFACAAKPALTLLGLDASEAIVVANAGEYHST